MTTAELVKYLRVSVDVLDPDSQERDELYLKLSDEDILLYLNIARTSAFAEESLDNFPEEYIYPLMLLAKKELYLSLALKHASYVDLMADDNNQLKKSQWFDHYMKLVNVMGDTYNAYVEQGGAGGYTLYSASTYLGTRYYTDYNREKEIIPSIRVRADRVTTNTIEVSWEYTASRLHCFKVFVSQTPIVDYYEQSDNQIAYDAKEVATISDPHFRRCRINGCLPDTDYYVTVTVTDWAGVTVYQELKVTTLSDSVETPDDIVEASL